MRCFLSVHNHGTDRVTLAGKGELAPLDEVQLASMLVVGIAVNNPPSRRD